MQIQAPLPIRWALARFILDDPGAASARKIICPDGARRAVSPCCPRAEKQAEALANPAGGRRFPAIERCATFIGDAPDWRIRYEDTGDGRQSLGAPMKSCCFAVNPQFSTTTTGPSLKEWKKHYSGRDNGTSVLAILRGKLHRRAMFDLRSWRLRT